MSDNPVINSIQSELDANDVVLFMKGTPVFPSMRLFLNGGAGVEPYWC